MVWGFNFKDKWVSEGRPAGEGWEPCWETLVMQISHKPVWARADFMHHAMISFSEIHIPPHSRPELPSSLLLSRWGRNDLQLLVYTRSQSVGLFSESVRTHTTGTPPWLELRVYHTVGPVGVASTEKGRTDSQPQLLQPPLPTPQSTQLHTDKEKALLNHSLKNKLGFFRLIKKYS